MRKFFITCLIIILGWTQIIPVSAKGIVPLDEKKIKSSVYLLMDRENKEILDEKDSHQLIHPASITKVLTTITALEMLEDIDLENTYYTIEEEVFIGLDPIASVAGFEPHEKRSLKDILYGIMLPSGADATRAISMFLTKDPEGLSKEMNKKAKEIGMKNSHFVNTSGLDHPDHLSTAYDLALLVDYALENEEFRNIYQSREYLAAKNEQHPNGIEFHNRPLVLADKEDEHFIRGAKSGYTEKAGLSLSSWAVKGSQELIFISSGIFEEKANYKWPVRDALYAYQRSMVDFQKVTAVHRQTILDSIPIKNAQDFQFKVEEDINVYIPKDLNLKDLQIQIVNKPQDLIAPVEAKTPMGTLKISYHDKLIHQENIQNKKTIPVLWTQVIKEFLKILFDIALILALILASIYWALKKKREAKAV